MIERNPESRPIITMISSNEYALDSECCAENEVAALLDFFGNLKSRWAVINYNLLGETERLTTRELKRDPLEPDLDHDTFLRTKAHELLCATDVKIKLVNPDSLDISEDFDF